MPPILEPAIDHAMEDVKDDEHLANRLVRRKKVVLMLRLVGVGLLMPVRKLTPHLLSL